MINFNEEQSELAQLEQNNSNICSFVKSIEWLLNSEHWQTRCKVLEILNAAPQLPNQVGHLIASLLTDDSHYLVRIRAVRTVYLHFSSDAALKLLEASKDDHPVVNSIITSYIQKIREK